MYGVAKVFPQLLHFLVLCSSFAVSGFLSRDGSCRVRMSLIMMMGLATSMGSSLAFRAFSSAAISSSSGQGTYDGSSTSSSSLATILLSMVSILVSIFGMGIGVGWISGILMIGGVG